MNKGNNGVVEDNNVKTPSFTVAANIKSAADGVISTLFSRVYNNEAWKTNPKTYTVEEAEAAFSELNYYAFDIHKSTFIGC